MPRQPIPGRAFLPHSANAIANNLAPLPMADYGGGFGGGVANYGNTPSSGSGYTPYGGGYAMPDSGPDLTVGHIDRTAGPQVQINPSQYYGGAVSTGNSYGAGAGGSYGGASGGASGEIQPMPARPLVNRIGSTVGRGLLRTLTGGIAGGSKKDPLGTLNGERIYDGKRLTPAQEAAVRRDQAMRQRETTAMIRAQRSGANLGAGMAGTYLQQRGGAGYKQTAAQSRATQINNDMYGNRSMAFGQPDELEMGPNRQLGNRAFGPAASQAVTAEWQDLGRRMKETGGYMYSDYEPRDYGYPQAPQENFVEPGPSTRVSPQAASRLASYRAALERLRGG